jgi:hypothetical protein
MKVTAFERRRARAAINRCLVQIRQTGALVSIVEDAEVLVIVDVYDGEGMCERMRVDPLNFIERLLQANSSVVPGA